MFVVAWMAGLLYLPRIFVYHSMDDTTDETSNFTDSSNAEASSEPTNAPSDNQTKTDKLEEREFLSTQNSQSGHIFNNKRGDCISRNA